jgi:hypothetical protein
MGEKGRADKRRGEKTRERKAERTGERRGEKGRRERQM